MLRRVRYLRTARCRGAVSASVIAAALAAAAPPSPARADGSTRAGEPADHRPADHRPVDRKWREVWAGADATPHVWLTYAGATVAPYGDVWTSGLKLRAVAGYGQYRYSGARDGNEVATAFTGQIAFAEALAGWLWRLGPLTAKAFAGVAVIEHAIAPIDPLASNGLQIGPKGALELWLDVGPAVWTSLDVSYTTAHDTYAVHARTGYRLWPQLSAGPEAVLNGSAGRDAHERETGMLDPAHRDIRFGGFLRYEWSGGEISASGGFSTDMEARRDPYATVNYIKQF